MTLLVASPSSE